MRNAMWTVIILLGVVFSSPAAADESTQKKEAYGDKIESVFNLTRQGIRWRFKRIFNEIYVEAYLAVFYIESNFGTDLRQMAMEIARERVALRKKAQKMDNFELCRREKGSEGPKSEGAQL